MRLARLAKSAAILVRAQRRRLLYAPWSASTGIVHGEENQMTLPFQPQPQAAPEAYSEVPDATGDIVTFILERFHTVHRNELPGLIELARKVESEHSGHAESPRGVAEWLETMAENLESHLQKEEQILFPMMLSGGHPMIAAPISVMRAEHEDHELNLEALTGLTNNLRLPGDASPAWRALYAGLAKFAADLNRHIYVENEILFPRFGA
jgi:regulator of cell morphogenesis and NO signaling